MTQNEYETLEVEREGAVLRVWLARGERLEARELVVAQEGLLADDPRGSLALDKVSRAHAWLRGRDQVTPDDIRAVINDCLRHRIIPSFEAQADGVTTDDIIATVVKLVAVA